MPFETSNKKLDQVIEKARQAYTSESDGSEATNNRIQSIEELYEVIKSLSEYYVDIVKCLYPNRNNFYSVNEALQSLNNTDYETLQDKLSNFIDQINLGIQQNDLNPDGQLYRSFDKVKQLIEDVNQPGLPEIRGQIDQLLNKAHTHKVQQDDKGIDEQIADQQEAEQDQVEQDQVEQQEAEQTSATMTTDAATSMATSAATAVDTSHHSPEDPQSQTATTATTLSNSGLNVHDELSNKTTAEQNDKEEANRRSSGLSIKVPQ